jgi:hypothetical protein
MIYHSPIYHARMIWHYEDLLENPKDEEHRILLMEQLWYHRKAYEALMN